MLIQNRSLLVQVQTDAGIKNILFNPTDGPSNRATPVYRRLTEATPRMFAKPFYPKPNRCSAQLAELGLTCADIDLIAFDHFHTQDLRPLLGAAGFAARFPNALLLAPRSEWEAWDDLPMLQKAWSLHRRQRNPYATRPLGQRRDARVRQRHERADRHRARARSAAASQARVTRAPHQAFAE